MFEELTNEQISQYKKRLRFVGRMFKIYLPLMLFSLYIYFYPIAAAHGTYFHFDVNGKYIFLGVCLTALFYYSLQRTTTVYNMDLARRFIYTKPRLDKIGKKIRFLFSQKEKRFELGIVAILYVLIPRVATSPSVQFLVMGTKSQYADEIYNEFLAVGGKPGFLNELYITLIVLPIMLCIFIIANISAMNYWDTAQRAQEIDKENRGPNEQKRLEKLDKKGGKRAYRIAIIAYFLGGTALTFCFPVLFNGINSIVWFVLARIILVVAGIYAVILLLRFLRAFKIRRKFVKQLRRLCKENNFEISKINHPYRTLFTLYNGEDFRVSFNGKSYSCKILCSLKRGDPLFIMKGGIGARIVNLKFLRLSLFSYTKSFKFGWEADCKKIIIVNPTPLQILVPGGNKPVELDNGDIVDGYEIYAATAFMNAMERDVIDID